MLIDTHCHIHEADYPYSIDDTVSRAHAADIKKMVCVGTSLESSKRAVEAALANDSLYSAIGIHPHETQSDNVEGIEALVDNQKLVAIGEIGLDYFYSHSPRDTQIKALEWQLDFATRHNLPVIFHVREAFDDFWPIFDNFTGIRGVLHSFTDSSAQLEKAVTKGLMIGVNGISTFTKSESQRAMFASIPISNLIFETDAPFLTPAPLRGKVNEPAFVREIATFHASLRNISFEELASATTTNAHALFAL